jgi:hypothetical protein
VVRHPSEVSSQLREELAQQNRVLPLVVGTPTSTAPILRVMAAAQALVQERALALAVLRVAQVKNGLLGLVCSMVAVEQVEPTPQEHTGQPVPVVDRMPQEQTASVVVVAVAPRSRVALVEWSFATSITTFHSVAVRSVSPVGTCITRSSPLGRSLPTLPRVQSISL